MCIRAAAPPSRHEARYRQRETGRAILFAWDPATFSALRPNRGPLNLALTNLEIWTTWTA